MNYTISRKSWHFRLYRYYMKELKNESVGRTVCLCPYMRSLLIWLPLRFFFMRLMFPITITVLSCIGLAGVVGELGWLGFFKVLGAVLAGLAVILGAILLGVWLYTRYQMYTAVRDAFPGAPKEPTTLVGQWLKANHEKICPCFEITD